MGGFLLPVPALCCFPSPCPSLAGSRYQKKEPTLCHCHCSWLAQAQEEPQSSSCPTLDTGCKEQLCRELDLAGDSSSSIQIPPSGAEGHSGDGVG